MINIYWKKVILIFTVLVCFNAFTQVPRSTSPIFVTFTELNNWTQTGSTASSSNVSTVPLATRVENAAAQIKTNMSFNMKIDWVVDGVDRWNNYMSEIPKFNTYNFTNWAMINKFTWFSNNADGVFIPPKPLIEAAHKNGVKVVGTIIMGGFQNGNTTAYTNLLKTSGGKYVAAQKLVDIMTYYGFDGYLFNMEAKTTSTNATALQGLMREIQTICTTNNINIDLSWYDSVNESGTLAWQDQMNTGNDAFFKNANGITGNSFFTNYNWGDADITTSITTATNLSRSALDVYMGTDAWTRNSPNGYLYNKNFMNFFHTNGDRTKPRISIALYAFGNLIFEDMGNNVIPNITFVNDKTDWFDYYLGESMLFSGDDYNVANDDATSTITTATNLQTVYTSDNNHDLGPWRGIGYYIPARTVITSLPFETNFNVGQGQIKSVNGVQTTTDWSDMGKQDILPSWQWAVTGTGTIVPRFDLTTAYNGGSSIKLSGALNNNNNAIKLYQTKLPITSKTKFNLVYKAGTAGATNLKLQLYFSDNLTTPVELDLGNAPDTNWNTKVFDLSAYSSKELNIIGVKAASTTSVPAYSLNLGNFKIFEDTSSTLGVDNSNKEKLTIYPNPVKGIAYVNLPSNATGKSTLKVYTANGQMIESKSYNNGEKISVNTNRFAKGIYIIKLENSNKTYTDKLIVE